MNNQELTAVIYRAIVAVTEENKVEDKVPSHVEMAEKIASDVLLYLENNSNIR
jgi:ABC-type arginine transport system ATPase subunit